MGADEIAVGHRAFARQSTPVCPYCNGGHSVWSCEVKNAADLAEMQQAFNDALDAAWPVMSATIAAYEAASIASANGDDPVGRDGTLVVVR